MKVTVTFEIDDAAEDIRLAVMLRDAIQDFIRLREPVKRYVAERYKTHPQSFRDMKLKSVLKRVNAAKSIREVQVTSEP